MGKLSDLFRSVYSFLFVHSSQEERVAAYVIREHDRGRSLNHILDDPYVRNRCSESEVARVLDRPDVLRAIGDDLARSAKTGLASG